MVCFQTVHRFQNIIGYFSVHNGVGGLLLLIKTEYKFVSLPFNTGFYDMTKYSSLEGTRRYHQGDRQLSKPFDWPHKHARPCT